MRKLLLLILLIPVLSWADCGPETLEKYKGFAISSKEIQELRNTHCEQHRCAALNQHTRTCICQNLGGVVRDKIDGKYYERCANNEIVMLQDYHDKSSRIYHNLQHKHYQEKSQALVPPPTTTTTPTPTTSPTSTTTKVTIEDAKSQCSDIGFKKGTERFGECVLE